MDDTKKLALLSEWQSLQNKIDTTNEKYKHTDEYAYMRKLRDLFAFDGVSFSHTKLEKLNAYLEGRIVYSSSELVDISNYFDELALITKTREITIANKEKYLARIDEIKKELGV